MPELLGAREILEAIAKEIEKKDIDLERVEREVEGKANMIAAKEIESILRR